DLPKNSKSVQVRLIDSLGVITLSIPNRYDTNFSWTHYSDCGKPCNYQKYRFQPTSFLIFKESGFIWKQPKGFVDRLTISHSGYFPFHDGDSTSIFTGHNHFLEMVKTDPIYPPIIFDTIQKINDRYFSIIAMERSDSLQARTVLATTTIKNNYIDFDYE